MNILFWNINKKNIVKELCEISNLHKVDLIVLCENIVEMSELVKTLNKGNSNYKISNSIVCDKISILSKFNLSKIKLVLETKRWTIRKIIHPLYNPFLIVAVHLPSKYSWNESSQFTETIVLRDSIEKAMIESGISRVIVIGDLNMNPFENSVISTKGMHATCDRNIAKKIEKTVQGTKYRYFYNPMWNFLGDDSIGNVPGTYYFHGSEHAVHNWNIFDQILLSPELLDSVDNSDIQILTSSTSFSLVNINGIINKKLYSDHLPILVKIKPNLN